MKKGWLLIIGLAVILGMASFAAVRALTNADSMPGSVQPAFAPLHTYLGLSAEQRRKLSAIESRFVATRPELRERVLAARDELLRVLNDPNASVSDGIAAAEKFSLAQRALQLHTVQYIFEMREHLTPAQKAKLAGVMGRGMCGFVCGDRPRGGWRGGGCGLGLGGGPRGGRAGRY